MEKTTDYGMFKFRNDNRDGGVKRPHVEAVKESIRKHNLLHLRPISVNKDFEIIDGQHRFTAAKELGIPIYYERSEELTANDIILMNVSKAWSSNDFFNYYVENHFPEYLKLEKFMKENSLTLTIALGIVQGGKHSPRKEFREGRFKFSDENASEFFDVIWRTIQIIEKNLGTKNWIKSSKLWRALLMMIKHPNFKEDKWFKNLELFVMRIRPKVATMDYLNMFKDIFNFRNSSKIEDLEEYKGDE